MQTDSSNSGDFVPKSRYSFVWFEFKKNSILSALNGGTR